MALHIVLIEPEIHTNTGNIGRLSLATGATLHLVKPFGFELTDSRLKRAGLDYWKHIDLKVYENLDSFLEIHSDKNLALLSSHGSQSYWEIDYKEDMYFVFGKESSGLPKELIEKFQDNIYKIPLYSENIRSLNLANSVGIVMYESLRNLNSSGVRIVD